MCCNTKDEKRICVVPKHSEDVQDEQQSWLEAENEMEWWWLEGGVDETHKVIWSWKIVPE